MNARAQIEKIIDNATVLGFVYGVALTSALWIAFMVATGGAQ